MRKRTLPLSVSAFRSQILDSSRGNTPDYKRTNDSKNRGANNIGQIMRAQIQTRKTNQHRNRQASQTDSSSGQQKHAKETGRSIDVTRWKRVILRIGEVRSVPHVLGFHRWSRPTS